MSRKRKTYSADFKARLVLEVLEGERTLNEIASHYEVLPKNLLNWKKQFLENMSLAFDKSAVVKEYKEEIETLQSEKDKIAKKLGETIVEKEFLEGKLISSVSSKERKALIETEHVLSQNRQCRLLHINKSGLYYKAVIPFSSEADIALLDAIDAIYTESPSYGVRRITEQLQRDGFDVGRKHVRTAMRVMGITALYPKPRTSVANKAHHKHPYLLGVFKDEKGRVVIEQPNQVWSTDITYIKLEKGFAYLAAIIDWNTKKVLSWRLSNTMDVSLTTGVLKEALAFYPKPDILNTDQGSQYTADEHIQILVDHGISISMDAKGRSIDNIVIERFWRTLKYEDVYLQHYDTIREAETGIGRFIKYYNTRRLHSSIGYDTPDEAYYQAVNMIAHKTLQDVA